MLTVDESVEYGKSIKEEDEHDESDSDEESKIPSSIFLFKFPDFFLPSPNPIMKSFNLLTSDSFTGFNKNSSAPSSKHLSIINKLQSEFTPLLRCNEIFYDKAGLKSLITWFYRY